MEPDLLIVSASMVEAALIAEVLHLHRYHVQCVCSGQEAIQILEQARKGERSFPNGVLVWGRFLPFYKDGVDRTEPDPDRTEPRSDGIEIMRRAELLNGSCGPIVFFDLRPGSQAPASLGTKTTYIHWPAHQRGTSLSAYCTNAALRFRSQVRLHTGVHPLIRTPWRE